MNEQAVEAEVQAKGLAAPRITPEHVESLIKRVHYHLFLGTTTMACLLELKNGFTVLGKSACASPENFDMALGEKIAYANAREKIWELEGYLLKQQLHTNSQQTELFPEAANG